jgi:type VI secretion system protein ImpH
MGTPGREIDPDLKHALTKEMLAEEPWRFHFFQAVRLLESMDEGRVSVGGFMPPDREVVRFFAHQSTASPASEIQALKFQDGKPAEMTVNFMGLTGPQGLLTLYYTEYVMERMRRKDHTLQDFLDIFNHRAISLFYQGWKKYRSGLTSGLTGARPLATQLQALIGIGTKGLQNSQDIDDETLVHYAGLFSQQPHSAIALEQILSDYFDVPVEVEQFVGAWCALDQSSQCSLDESGRASEKLGQGAIIGDEMWDKQAVVRIKLGPLSLAEYLDFLPTGTAWKPLKALVRFYANDQFDFEAQLILRREEAPRCELGGSVTPRLGWTAWATTRAMERDPDDTILKL